MCGIFGIMSPDGMPIPDQLIAKMAQALHHRGPDHTGIHTAPGISMGNTRLAIIDLATGNQPLYNEDGSLVIVFNGEIYNHADLRRKLQEQGHLFRTSSDTEVILHAFEEYGNDCVSQLNGMFAFAIWSSRTGTLFLARDHLGIKPLYLILKRERVAFASEAKALLHLLPGPPRPNWTAINRYFCFGYHPSPDSPFLDITKVPPGTTLTIDKLGQREVRRYWIPHFGEGLRCSAGDLDQRVSQAIEEAVRAELISDVPMGIFLSGGIDSSAVALYAKRNSQSLTHSFSLGFAEASHDESADAFLVARHLGLNHHELRMTPATIISTLQEVAEVLDEPFADPTVIPLLALAKYARSWVKVVLTGWGGDELFAGYPTYFAHLLAKRYRCLPEPIAHRFFPWVVAKLPVGTGYMSLDFKARKFLEGMDEPPEIQHFHWMGYFSSHERSNLFRPDILGCIHEPALAPVWAVKATLEDPDLISRILNLDARFFLEGNGLFQADRMTMAASLEARVPLLNHVLTGIIAPVPTAQKMPGGHPKGLFRRVLKNLLPRRIIRKPKKGFGPPSSQWMKASVFPFFNAAFSHESIEHNGIFNGSEVKRYFEEHVSGTADHGRKLWALLSFQTWFDKWILNKSRPLELQNRRNP